MSRGLCCLPIQIKSKYYPLVLVGIFSLFFGPQLALWTGLGVGYLWVFKYIQFMETSAPALKKWEQRWPFKNYLNHPSFQGSSSSLVSNSSVQGSGVSFFGGGNSSGTATQGGPSAPRQEESKQSSFRAFAGRGVALGQTPDIE